MRRWVERLRDSRHPELRDCGVLIRPHPYNSAHWKDVTLSGTSQVEVFPRHGSSPARASDRADFFDSLYHATAVVGLNTSAMIEAAIVGRPVLTVLSPDFATTQTGTLHFHYLLPDHGGFVRPASTFEEHIEHLVAAFAAPDQGRARAEEFVGTFVRPLGRDLSAASAVANAVERLAGQRPCRSPRPPVWMPAARCALWCIGLAGAIQDPVRRRRVRREILSGTGGVKRKSLTELDYHAARQIYGAARKRRKRRKRRGAQV